MQNSTYGFRQKAWFTFFLLVTILVATSCISTVSYLRYKPAIMDMTRYKTVGVIHTLVDSNFGYVPTSPYYLANLFSYRYTNRDYKTQLVQQQLCAYASEALEDALHQSSYFKVVDINPASYNSNVPLTNSQIGELYNVDAIILGTITSLYWSDRSYSQTNVEYDTNNTPTSSLQEQLQRSYHLTLSYQVIETSSGAIIYSKMFNHSTTENDSSDEDSFYSMPIDVFCSMVNSDVNAMRKLLAPYQIKQKVKLQFNSNFNNEFLLANKMVRSREYNSPMEIYMRLWNDYQIPQALYNASIIYELKTDLDSAYQAMNILYNQFPKSKYKKRLAHLETINYEQLQVLRQKH